MFILFDEMIKIREITFIKRGVNRWLSVKFYVSRMKDIKIKSE